MHLLRLFFVPSIAFILVFAIGLAYLYTENKNQNSNTSLHTKQLASTVAISIERDLSSSLAATYLLASEVKANKGVEFDFIRHAKDLITSNKGIANIQLAPDGIVSYIYPIEGHQKALGHNIIRDDKRRGAASEAIKTRKLTVAGPYQLIQGGVSIIGRYPIFLDENYADHFWGFSTVLINLESLISRSDLPRLEREGYQYQIYYINPETEREEIFAGTKSEQLLNSESSIIKLPNQIWTINLVAPQNPHRYSLLYMRLALITVLSLVVSYILFNIYQRREKLQGLVVLKEGQLDYLKHDRQLIRSLIDCIPDLIYYNDCDGTYLGCNKAFELFAETDSANIIGKTVNDLSDYVIHLSNPELDLRVLASGKTIIEQKELIKRDNSTRVIEVARAPYYDLNGNLLGLLGVGRDITEIKRAEAKSHFLATMSHEIRTPLNGLLGMLELLSGSRLAPKQLELVNNVRLSAGSLNRIIDDILDFAKIESGQLNIVTSRVNFHQLIESVASTFATNAFDKAISYHLIVDPKINSLLLLDEVRVKQVIANLINNAVKFTCSGGVSISCSLIEQGANEQTISVKISDTGIGIADEHKERLFQPFLQAEDSTTRRFGGTGLGLAICRHLAGLLGAELHFESQLNQGSCFEFIFTATELADERAATSFDGISALVLCDDPQTMIQLNSIASRCDLSLYPVSQLPKSFDQISSIAEKENVDVIILDQKSIASTYNLDQSRFEFLASYLTFKTIVLSATPVSCTRELNNNVIYTSGYPLYSRQFVNATSAVMKPVAHDQYQHIDRRQQKISNSNYTTPPVKHSDLILVAEDHPMNQILVKKQLEAIGLNAVVVKDGYEALIAWRTGSYDLLLTDCHMPNMDGYTLAENIRTEEENTNKRIPIIALTAAVLDDEKQKCLNSGMDAVISKPTEVKAMYSILCQWLTNH